MSIVLYFGMMLCLVGVGLTICGLTFRQWYIDRQAKQSAEQALSDGNTQA